MSDTSANFPAGDPLDPQGRLTPQWRMFFLALFNRTGGTGQTVDISTLQTSIANQGKEISDLFMLEGANASVALVGALMQRVAQLETAVQSIVPVSRAVPASLPDPVTIRTATATSLPEPVQTSPKDPTTDIYKMVSK